MYFTTCSLVPSLVNPESIALYNQRLVHNLSQKHFDWFWKLQPTSCSFHSNQRGLYDCLFRDRLHSAKALSATLCCRNLQARAKEEVGLPWRVNSPFYIPSFSHSAFCTVRRDIYRDVRLLPTQPPSAALLLPVLSQGKYVDAALSHLGTTGFGGFSTDFTLWIYSKTHIKLKKKNAMPTFIKNVLDLFTLSYFTNSNM